MKIEIHLRVICSLFSSCILSLIIIVSSSNNKSNVKQGKMRVWLFVVIMVIIKEWNHTCFHREQQYSFMVETQVHWRFENRTYLSHLDKYQISI